MSDQTYRQQQYQLMDQMQREGLDGDEQPAYHHIVKAIFVATAALLDVLIDVIAIIGRDE